MAFNSIQSFVKNDKTKFKNAICVFIDLSHSVFEFSSIDNFDKNTYKSEQKPFKCRIYSEEFFSELSQAVKSYASSKSEINETAVTLVVPNNAVAMDTVSLPNLSRKRNEEALEASLTGLYKKRSDVRVNHILAAQSKQVVTYSLSVMNENLFKSLSEAMANGGMPADFITFSSNAVVNAVSQLNPKIKNSTYLLLNIKHHSSTFAFVSKGRTTGYFDLPFGYSILQKNKVFSEDILFDHTSAELAVLNAKEKAKAKQLTVMNDENTQDEDAEENLDAMFGGDENATADPTANITAAPIKTLPKKEPRKLPKFMQRPLPTNEEEYSYENFRLFIKWALNLIQSNDKLSNQGKPETVFVNMPDELSFLFEKVNQKAEENGIAFASADVRKNNDKFIESIESFGGLFSSLVNRSNNFSD